MESRKRLYKTTRNVPTVTDRVKQDNNRRLNTRKNAFNANRKIDLDDSISTPHKPAPVKISQIKDKPEKLRAYIESKRTAKFKETIQARSPFVPYVPIGRWVEKKEEPRRQQRVIITTPVRKALLGKEKILKIATLKQLATTAKKDTATRKVVKSKTDTNLKSRKKILREVNSDTAVDYHNNTFEILPDVDSEVNKVSTEDAETNQDVFLFKSKSCDIENDPEVAQLKEEIKLKSTVKMQKKKDPVIRTTSRAAASVKKVEPKKTVVPVKKVPMKAVVAKVVMPVKKPIEVKLIEAPQLMPIESLSSSAMKESLDVYKFYKTSHYMQIQYLTMHLKSIEADKDSYIGYLSEDDQAKIAQLVQRGNKLVNDKMKNFSEFLDKFKDSDQSNEKKADVENYFDLLYEEIEKFKEELKVVAEIKAVGLKKANEEKKKKRRTTRIASDATPRRSRRIADHQDSPMTHACFGCTPMSASKVNTPRSSKKRRTLFKNNELNFD